MEAFRGRTEADLYLWIMDHRHYLTEQAGRDPGAAAAVHAYTTRFGKAQLTFLVGALCDARRLLSRALYARAGDVLRPSG